MPYAEGTSVPVERTQMEIRGLVERYKGRGVLVGEDWQERAATVMFAMNGRRIRFKLSLTPENQLKGDRLARFHRERWRALFLTIKAKLVSAESGIEAFEEAFMAQTVMPDGRTVGEHALPTIALAYEGKEAGPLLTFGGGE